MLPFIKNFLAQQARRPSGWFGRVVAPKVFNKENRAMEQFGLELVAPKNDDHILEIGFGNGRLMAEMASQVQNGRLCGIDISDQMVALALQMNKQWIQEGRVEINKSSVESIPYEDGTFDKVFTANTIYFWPEPEKNLEEIKRVLKPGGRFYCALRLKPQMDASESAFKNSVVKNNREVFQHLFEGEEAQQLFKNAGFQNVTLHEKPGTDETVYVISGEK